MGTASRKEILQRNPEFIQTLLVRNLDFQTLQIAEEVRQEIGLIEVVPLVVDPGRVRPAQTSSLWPTPGRSAGVDLAERVPRSFRLVGEETLYVFRHIVRHE